MTIPGPICEFIATAVRWQIVALIDLHQGCALKTFLF